MHEETIESLNKLTEILEHQLANVRAQIEELKQVATREKNYRNFLNRPADWIVGRAHCDPNFTDNGWHHPPGEQMKDYFVHVKGNSGSSYFPTAMVTQNTMMYFHNCWTDAQRAEFQNDLNEVVKKHMLKMVADPRMVLELLGLQNNYFHMKEAGIYPKERVPEMQTMLREARREVMNQFSDEQLASLNPNELHHSGGILREYLESKRPHLSKKE